MPYKFFIKYILAYCLGVNAQWKVFRSEMHDCNMDPRAVVNQLLTALPSDIVCMRLRTLAGTVDGGAGESYFLVCADSMVADKITIQLYPEEYEAIKSLFLTNGTDVSEVVSLVGLTAAYS